MAVITMGIFSNTIQGIEGSIILMISHGFISPALFICASVLYDRYHTRLIKYYRGLVQFMPLFSVLFFLSILGEYCSSPKRKFCGRISVLSRCVPKKSYYYSFWSGPPGGPRVRRRRAPLQVSFFRPHIQSGSLID
jgi:NADH:ubiquinone oxidoreductase subunit 4 (subunit M)